MAVSRATVVDGNFTRMVEALPPHPGSSIGPRGSPEADLDGPVCAGTSLTARMALRLFEAQIESRLLDLLARDLKAAGESFYTIGSSGHEGNAAVAAALEPDDMAFLHYRSGAFFAARAQALPGPHGPFDVLLGLCASADEPIAGGRHKVFGSVPLHIPPQTSTIASHLPKAVGYAIALDRKAHRHGHRERRISVCTFGDASSNHATAATAFNAAGWATHQRIPTPVLFVCEDNGIGISVRTPEGWVATNLSSKAGIRYFAGDGLSLPSAWDSAREAADFVRRTRRPAILHLRTVRLLGHAGSDVEQLYRSATEIEAAEADDPLLGSARLLVGEGWLRADEVLTLYQDTRARLAALAREATRRPKLTLRSQVVAPLPAVTRAAAPVVVAPAEARRGVHGEGLPETQERPRHLAMQITRALTDILVSYPEAILFGEDVARKGGVYHVTAGLSERFGVGRVFNTLLDETSILGLAIGAGHAGLLPIPEIQYLAYLMNAIDQLRGEAGSMQYFSQGQYRNPMVVRVAGLAYQKGFGGHFHNDNGIAAVREIPGVIVGCPARGDDAALMLRGLVAQASQHGRVCVFLEPIALYMTKDLHADGDGEWLAPYPSPERILQVGEVRVYGDGADLCVASYANGLFMSLRVARRLEGEGHRVRVVDIRWLQPLPIGPVVEEVRAASRRLLIVDECRASSGVADTLAAEVAERVDGVRIRRVTGVDTYIPLGAAADLVLVGEDEITRAARALLEA